MAPARGACRDSARTGHCTHTQNALSAVIFPMQFPMQMQRHSICRGLQSSRRSSILAKPAAWSSPQCIVEKLGIDYHEPLNAIIERQPSAAVMRSICHVTEPA